jgi:hypothetical protein
MRAALLFLHLALFAGCVSENISYYAYCAPGEDSTRQRSFLGDEGVLFGAILPRGGYRLFVDPNQREWVIPSRCSMVPVNPDIEVIIWETSNTFDYWDVFWPQM